AVRPTADREPELDMSGVDAGETVMIDSVLPLRLSGDDDYGLKQVGLFYRSLGPATATTVAPAANDATDAAAPAESAEHVDIAWEQIELWQVPEENTSFSMGYDLPVALLNTVEGERLELAIRGRDTNPANADRWTLGASRSFIVSGAGIGLQLTYEQILR